jgi:glycerol-3-phosphate dehydrogenase (NAD(P)+)
VIAVLGAGAFGTALALALSGADRPVTLVARDAEGLARTRRSPRLPGIALPDAVAVAAGVPATVEAVLLAVPAQALGAVLVGPLPDAPLVACCKGIDLGTLTGPAGVIEAARPGASAAVLTGPSFADDIARGLPTALTLACTREAEGLQRLLSTETLRLYTTDDVMGAQIGGALKNVTAIACGAAIGAGLGESARAALMTRGHAETVRLAVALGARPETLAGLSGLGDLALTCTSERSRNYRAGLALGRGEPPEDVTTEGVATARAAVELARSGGMELPVAEAVSDITEGRTGVLDAARRLVARPLTTE